MTVVAFVGLGSNLDEPLWQITTALDEMRPLSRVPLQTSPLYGSKAVGPGEQPDYVNAVTRLETRLSARELLAALLRIERSHKRQRTQRWAARTLDLDLLVYGDALIQDPLLQVPHPRLAKRPFVLYPLFDLAPSLQIPGLGPLRELVGACPREGIWVLPDD